MLHQKLHVAPQAIQIERQILLKWGYGKRDHSSEPVLQFLLVHIQSILRGARIDCGLVAAPISTGIRTKCSQNVTAFSPLPRNDRQICSRPSDATSIRSSRSPKSLTATTVQRSRSITCAQPSARPDLAVT